MAEIHEIGQGRVWTSQRAIEIGLVDGLNTLEGTIQSAAKLAGIESYQVDEYPKSKSLYQQQAFLEKQLGDLYPHYKLLHEMQTDKGLQSRLPFFIHFD